MHPVSLFLLSSLSSAPQVFTLDPKESLFAVVVRKDASAILASASHDHAIHASELSGTIHWDSADPTACRIDITVPVSGLRADDPAVRKKLSVPGGEILLKNRGDVEDHMKAEDQLDAAKFPQIRFESTSCTQGQGGTVKVKGALTVHGTKKPIEVEMKYHLEGPVLRARGKFSAKHADFNMKPYSAALGAVKNAEELTFFIDAKADAKG